MRQAQGELLSVVIQLVFAGVLILTLIGFANNVYSKEHYEERVYATDTALTAEALLSRTQGVVRMPYLLPFEHKVKLGDIYVAVMSSEDEGYSMGRFTTNPNTPLQHSEGTGRIFHWTRSDTLSFVSATLSFNCPDWPEAPDAETFIVRAQAPIMQVKLSHAVDNALFEKGLDPDKLHFGGLNDNLPAADLEVRVEREDADFIFVRSGTDSAGMRLRCLLRSETAALPLPTAVAEDVTDRTAPGITIILPEDLATEQEDQFIEALTRALRRIR